MSSISLESLTKVYSTGATALSEVSLDVNSGEFVVLVGPSGCGKTTALRMVAGLESITSGVVRFGDRVINAVSPRQRDVAMVFQNYALYPHLSVYENIGFALTNKKVPKADRDSRIRSAAEILGLSDLLNRKPQHLSGGQRQRVAMGRALVREPSVFLMDEPLSNLDAKLRVQMRSEVLRVHRSIGAATLYVTHDQIEAMTMGDRVAVLQGGILQQYGTPRELYDHPANLFVAAFIGSPEMNLYEASVDSSGEDLLLGSQRLTIGASRPGLAAYQGRKIVVGFRPEDLALVGSGGSGTSASRGSGSGGSRSASGSASGSGSSGSGGFVADVRLVEMLGSELHVYFTIDAAAMGGTAASFLDTAAPNGVARLDPRSGVTGGSRVTFGVDADRMHFFDPDTGVVIG